jgi:hypothetical protein
VETFKESFIGGYTASINKKEAPALKKIARDI